VIVTNLLLALSVIAIWELNEIRKFMRQLWTNHYQLNRADLDDLLPHDALEPDSDTILGYRTTNFGYGAAHNQMRAKKLQGRG
jgi:hypothetical protein